MHKPMVLAALLVASCGSNPTQESADSRSIGAGAPTASAPNDKPSPATAASACDILTQAKAEAALGHAVTRNAEAGGGGLDICRYGYVGQDMMDRGNVSLTIQPEDIATLKSAVEKGGVAFESVPELGDNAYYSREAGLYVGKGGRTAIYRLGKLGQSDAREATIALARATTGQL